MFAALALAAAVWSLPAIAQTSADVAQASPTEIDAWLQSVLREDGLPSGVDGVVVGVVTADKLRVSRAVGFSDVQHTERMNPTQTRLLIGSISKLFIWLGALQLHERGLVDLGADVTQYVGPIIPRSGGVPVTLRRLMTHTAGFEQRFRAQSAAQPEWRRSLQLVATDHVPRRVFRGGDVPAYSNYGADLAAYILEIRSGATLDKYLRQNVFEPLTMDHTALAAGSEPDEARSLNGASQSAVTTADDMGILMGAYLAAAHGGLRGVLSPQTVAMQISTRAIPTSHTNTVLLGFMETSRKGVAGYGHAGDRRGTNSRLEIYPSLGAGVFVAVVGPDASATTQLREELFDHFLVRYGNLASPSPCAGAGAADTAAHQVEGEYETSRNEWSSFVGFRRFIGHARVRILKDGLLQFSPLDRTRDGIRRYCPIGDGVWRNQTGHERLAITTGDGGRRTIFVDEWPEIAFIEMPWWRSPSWLLPAFLVSLGVLACSIVAGWVGLALQALPLWWKTSLQSKSVESNLTLVSCTALLACLFVWSLVGTNWPWSLSAEADLFHLILGIFTNCSLGVAGFLTFRRCMHLKSSGGNLMKLCFACAVFFATVIVGWVGACYGLLSITTQY